MDNAFITIFESIVRKAGDFTEAPGVSASNTHPFDERNIHPNLPPSVRHLFDDGYYVQATFEAYKFLEKRVKQLAGKNHGNGFKLMMEVFDPNKPLLKLTNMATDSEIDIQDGYRFIFAGSIRAIRNPRGHEHEIKDSMDECLDYLSLASLLLRVLDDISS